MFWRKVKLGLGLGSAALAGLLAAAPGRADDASVAVKPALLTSEDSDKGVGANIELVRHRGYYGRGWGYGGYRRFGYAGFYRPYFYRPYYRPLYRRPFYGGYYVAPGYGYGYGYPGYGYGYGGGW